MVEENVFESSEQAGEGEGDPEKPPPLPKKFLMLRLQLEGAGDAKRIADFAGAHSQDVEDEKGTENNSEEKEEENGLLESYRHKAPRLDMKLPMNLKTDKTITFGMNYVEYSLTNQLSGLFTHPAYNVTYNENKTTNHWDITLESGCTAKKDDPKAACTSLSLSLSLHLSISLSLILPSNYSPAPSPSTL